VEGEPQNIQLPLVWAGVDEVPTLFANAVIAQFEQDLGAHILTIGQVIVPPLTGTDEEVAEQVAEIEFVQVRAIARLAFTPDKLQEAIGILQANVDQRERAATLRPGDPRND
jgi:hypothetical protein